MASIEEKVGKLLKAKIESIGYELYDVEYSKEGKNYFLRIFIDNEKGIDLNDCEKVNDAITDILDEENYIKEQYFLEVSSPGIERVLRKDKHLEQNIGGVETLFKTSADTIKNYAANAYKTAGLSANEYMETVTSFSASLIQSLGGDTEKAAEYANIAITDMSDNANKMGTSMESIQNAYQGFAKQNYTIKFIYSPAA